MGAVPGGRAAIAGGAFPAIPAHVILHAMSWVSLCRLDELTEGQGRYAEVGGFQLAVFLHGGEPFVLDNRCPHAGGSLSGGRVEAGCAVCPWHHWAFDLRSGQLRGKPFVKVRTYPARVLRIDGKPALVQAELPIF